VKITVVGLGKIGLPLAVQFASRGHEVLGLMSTRNRREHQLSAGAIPGEAHLQEKLTQVVGKGLLSATTDTAGAVAASDVVVMVVPLFVDGDGILISAGWTRPPRT